MPTGSPPDPARPAQGEQTDTAIAGIVLAGGASRRMGTDKALLQIEGETLLARAIRHLTEAGATTVVIACGTPGRYADHTDNEQIPDPPAHQGDGPLAGLAAAFTHLAPTHRRALVLAVDLPDADPVLLADLADLAARLDDTPAAPPDDTQPEPRGDAERTPSPAAIVPLDATGRAQPLHAAYATRRAGPAILGALERGERRVLKVVLDELHALTHQPTMTTTTDTPWARNLNTPEDHDQE